jgi:hypothetical protein
MIKIKIYIVIALLICLGSCKADERGIFDSKDLLYLIERNELLMGEIDHKFGSNIRWIKSDSTIEIQYEIQNELVREVEELAVELGTYQICGIEKISTNMYLYLIYCNQKGFDIKERFLTLKENKSKLENLGYRILDENEYFALLY